MPLENDNMELRRQQQEERWNIMRSGRSYLSPDEQEQQLWDKRAYAERLQEVRDIIRDGWPAEGPVPRGGAQMERVPTTYSERKILKKEKKNLRSLMKKYNDLRLARLSLSMARSERQLQEEGISFPQEQESDKLKARRDKEMIGREKQYLQTFLRTIKDKEEFLLQQAATKEQKLQVRLDCQNERAAAAAEYAKAMPLDSDFRREAMAVKEQEEIKANDFRKQLKIERMPAGPERKNAEDTRSRHARFDKMKSIMRILKGVNPLSHEEAAYRSPSGTLFVNKGRAFFGGTKPMYIFEAEDQQQYLYKEAINCVGFDKPQGALVTEAASRLQRRLCGEDHYIPAEAVEIDGKIVGSLQKKVDSWRAGDPGTPPPDLFKWQQNPDDSLNADTPEMAEVRAGLLREHALDWLLCNFDTKGENFLFDRNGNLVSFDKEASFSKLKDAGAQNMSYTYKPHSNDTIYNVLFSRYAQGLQKLDLTCTKQYVAQIEAMDDGEYMQQFERMLSQKYGKDTPKYQENYNLILNRKHQIRQKYEAFYQQLIAERRRNLPEGTPDDTAGLLNANGTFFD